jgi:hypothetical protein
MATLEELLAIDQELQAPARAPGQSASIDEMLSIQSELDQPQQPAAIGRPGRAASLTQEREATQQLLEGVESGEVTSQDLTRPQVEAVRRARVEAIPEINIGGFKKLSDNTNFLEAVSAMTTFDPDEFGRILTASDPDIGIVTTPEGERLAFNNKTNKAFSINKLGPSLIDATQVGISAAALAPATVAGGLAPVALASGAIQAGLETGQAAAGGEFDALPVAGAALAGPIISKIGQGANAAIQKLRSSLSLPAIKAPTSVEVGKNISPIFGQESKNMTAVREAIEKGEGDNIAAKYMIDGANKVVADPSAREVIKQGTRTDTFPEGLVAMIKGSSGQDKVQMAKSLDIIESGMTNFRKAQDNRPGKVVGETVMELFDSVRAENIKAGKAVGKSAKSLAGQQVNLSSPVASFLDDLDKLGVRVDGKKLNFFDSVIEGDKGAENILKAVWPRLQRLQNNPDGFKSHNFKKFIDTKIEAGKKSTVNPLTRDAQKVAENLRKNVNETLREFSPAYKEANVNFSETVGVLDKFTKTAGTNFNPDSPFATEFTGKLARRLLSNVQSRETLMESLLNLETVARKFGGKFDGDIGTQILFIDELEKTFGSFARTGISSEVAKGLGKAARGSKAEIAADIGGKIIDKAQRLNEQQTLKALRGLVERNR